MDAKWILSGVAIAMIALVSVENGQAGGGSEYAESIITLSGKNYREVRLVKVDPNGLLFRHRDGIAKVTFDDLDEGFREYYGYDKARAEEFERAHTGQGSKPALELAEGERVVAPDAGETVTVTFRTRTLVRLPYRQSFANAQAACGGTPWFSHWGRYHPGLAYARFPCRQLATRDLLISAGILPTPPGISVYRFPR